MTAIFRSKRGLGGSAMSEEGVTHRLWAKTDRTNRERYHPLLFHMLDVAAVCEALAPRFTRAIPISDPWLAYLAGLHDVGKADPRFQNKDAERATALRDLGFSLSDRVVSLRRECRSSEWVREPRYPGHEPHTGTRKP